LLAHLLVTIAGELSNTCLNGSTAGPFHLQYFDCRIKLNAVDNEDNISYLVLQPILPIILILFA
jgi:hypothetical protein